MKTMANWRNCILITSGTCLCWTVIVLLNVFANVSSSSYAIQSHEGSAPTNEFTLNQANPNARIIIDSSSSIVVINVEPPSNSHKVSLELLAMQLCDGKGEDRLKIVYSDPTRIKTETWKLNVTSSNENRKELHDIQANQIVLIPEGRWVISGADLVATLYTDAGTFCPPSAFRCSCTSRCIPTELTCNGNPNCGLGCKDEDDETEKICPSSSNHTFSSTIVTENCEKPVPGTTEESREDEDSGGALVKATALNVVNVLVMILVSCVILK